MDTELQPKPHVLIVDDESAVRRAVARVLRRHGCEVTPAASNQEAHAHLDERSEGFDAAILDLALPDGVPSVLLRRLRSHDVGPCAIALLTGQHPTAAGRLALAEGVDELVLKPANPNMLKRALDALLNRTRTLRGWMRGEADGRRPLLGDVADLRLLVSDADENPFGYHHPALKRAIASIAQQHLLTPAQVRILPWICQARENEEIAAALQLSIHTVRNHVKAILRKTGSGSRSTLIAKMVAEVDREGDDDEDDSVMIGTSVEDAEPRIS